MAFVCAMSAPVPTTVYYGCLPQEENPAVGEFPPSRFSFTILALALSLLISPPHVHALSSAHAHTESILAGVQEPRAIMSR